MKTIKLDKLPPGAKVRGTLYDDSSMEYDSGDVLEVELSNGITIDVGWDKDEPEAPFRIVVYRESFGDRFVDFRARDTQEVQKQVQRLAEENSAASAAPSCLTVPTSNLTRQGGEA